MELLSLLNESLLSCSRLTLHTYSLKEVPNKNRKSVSLKDICWQQGSMVAGLNASAAAGTGAPHADI
jgi:hypothetical protein